MAPEGPECVGQLLVSNTDTTFILECFYFTVHLKRVVGERKIIKMKNSMFRGEEEENKAYLQFSTSHSSPPCLPNMRGPLGATH